MSSEDFEVDREGVAVAGEPDTWTSPSAAFRESMAVNGPAWSGGPAVVEVSRHASPVTVLWFGADAEPEPGS